MGQLFGRPSGPYCGDVCDPHCHFWDFAERPNPHHADGLGAKLPKWLPDDYLEKAATLADLRITSIVHVETIDEADPEGETRWIMSLSHPLERKTKIVCFVDLSLESAKAQLEHQAALGAVGVRHILNKNPSWPNVRADYVDDEAFRSNYARLADHGMSFDAQLNPHQMLKFAELVEATPGVPVMLNHLGCLKLESYVHDHIPTPGEHARRKAADAEAEAVWRAGLRRLAASKHVFIKLSMCPYAVHEFWKHEDAERRVASLLREVIDLFGPERCCFASNCPVDVLDGLEFDVMYAKFREMTAHLPYADQRCLFHDTAAKFYKVA